MTHQPQQILVRVETKDRLPKETGEYTVSLTDNGIVFKAIFYKEKSRWVPVSTVLTRNIDYWYEPATAIVLSVEKYEKLINNQK